MTFMDSTLYINNFHIINKSIVINTFKNKHIYNNNNFESFQKMKILFIRI